MSMPDNPRSGQPVSSSCGRSPQAMAFSHVLDIAVTLEVVIQHIRAIRFSIICYPRFYIYSQRSLKRSYQY